MKEKRDTTLQLEVKSRRITAENISELHIPVSLWALLFSSPSTMYSSSVGTGFTSLWHLMPQICLFYFQRLLGMSSSVYFFTFTLSLPQLRHTGNPHLFWWWRGGHFNLVAQSRAALLVCRGHKWPFQHKISSYSAKIEKKNHPDVLLLVSVFIRPLRSLVSFLLGFKFSGILGHSPHNLFVSFLGATYMMLCELMSWSLGWSTSLSGGVHQSVTTGIFDPSR